MPSVALKATWTRMNITKRTDFCATARYDKTRSTCSCNLILQCTVWLVNIQTLSLSNTCRKHSNIKMWCFFPISTQKLGAKVRTFWFQIWDDDQLKIKEKNIFCVWIFSSPVVRCQNFVANPSSIFHIDCICRMGEADLAPNDQGRVGRGRLAERDEYRVRDGEGGLREWWGVHQLDSCGPIAVTL